tara:strand:+ start:654 stop:809 length:156 start_codon:yes stop_codon:yes gene_type:complete
MSDIVAVTATTVDITVVTLILEFAFQVPIDLTEVTVLVRLFFSDMRWAAVL